MAQDRIKENHPERRTELQREQIKIADPGEPRQKFASGGADTATDAEMVILEDEIEEIRLASRVLIMLGTFLLIFAAVWLLYSGWDIREGRRFMPTMTSISAIGGVALIIAGAIKRSRRPALHEDRRHSGQNRAA